jgi:hypothetical protein
MSFIMNNKIVQFLLVLGVGGILITLPFMAAVSSAVGATLVIMGGLLTLVAIVWVFTEAGKR